MDVTTGKRVKTEALLEIEQRESVDISAADYTWGSQANSKLWFKVVTAEDCLIKCKLLGEDDLSDTQAKAIGYYPFPKGEGSNAKVIKLYHDDSNTLGGAIWAVR